ncbi:MAG: L,D-transpeptidase family protein [Hyphomicrobium sp.]
MRFSGAATAVLPAAVIMFLTAATAPVVADPTPADTATQAATPPAAPAPAAAAQAPAASDPAKDAAAKPADTPAAPTAAAATPTPVPVASPVVAANPVVDAVRSKLADKAFAGKAIGDHVEALKSFYAARGEPLWIKDGAFSANANAAMAEIKKADAYGLDATQFALPELAAGASADAQGEAEASLGLAVLKYAHQARGGRVDPLSLSNILDMKPPLKDPAAVLTEIAASSSPDTYLRGLHPKHAGFEKLRLALEKARGPQVEEKIDEALLVKLPDGKTIKPGEENDDVVLLRKRLKIEAAAGANEKLYDPILEAAVKAFQADKGIKSNGQLNAKTRTALNREGEPKKADPKRDVDRIIVNMERWRWLPEDLGPFYIANNIPEFMTRVVKGEQEVWKSKIIVGQPSWPTPVLTSSLLYVIFQPEWGVPDGIKVKELLPRLKRASPSGGGGFFDQLFGGGSSGGARVLAAYKLKPTLNGRPVDANSIDWNSVDIRRFSFVQPAGGENPLGSVKFRFPNRHDVYMHDTPQKALFGQSFRALSHGCMRVENPRRFAEVLLAEDKGWSPEKVSGMYGGGTRDVTLDKPVPVYLTYFTASVDETGKVQKFGDLYGHDDRLMSALQGKAVRYTAPEAGGEVASADDATDPVTQPQQTKKNANKKPVKKKNTETAGDIFTDALSGLLAN